MCQYKAVTLVDSGSFEICVEWRFQARLARSANGYIRSAGPQAGPKIVVNQGRSMIPDCSMDWMTRFQCPRILRITHLEGLTDESRRKPAAANGAAIQGAT